MLNVNISELQTLAAQLANKMRFPCCIGLWGDLGAGKTTFTQAFIKSLAPLMVVNSPTFTLNQIYTTPMGDIYHWDLYRIEHANELYEVGFEEIVHNYACIIEWPERAGQLLPLNRIDIHFKIISSLEREIIINGITA